MWIRRLRLDNVRCLAEVELQLGCGLHVFVGANGAGKTSLLEGAYLLSHARSFRAGTKENLVRLGAGPLSVFAEVCGDGGGHVTRLGLQRQGGRWVARMDGETLSSLDGLLRRIAVVCFEPGSHELISGPGEERRAFLDWMLFHVEHDFLSEWRAYHRAVKQRNSLLRMAEVDAESLAAWGSEVVRRGTALNGLRQAIFSRWAPLVVTQLRRFLPELGEPALTYRRGWKGEIELETALAEREALDRVRGFTSVGPHRGDWTPAFERAPLREHLSRGQAKLCALACVLAQAELVREASGEWPVICLDDLSSELDAAHQAEVLRYLAGTPAQILITGTDGLAFPDGTQPHARFHVEQGRVTPLL